MLDKSVFDMIDEHARENGVNGSFLLFIAQCAGVDGSEDLNKLSGLKSLASQRDASEDEINKDIMRLGIVQDLLTGYYNGTVQAERFDGCKNSNEFFEAAELLKLTTSEFITETAAGLPSNWMVLSGAVSLPDKVFMPGEVYYQGRVLQYSEEVIKATCPSTVFTPLGGADDYREMLSVDMSETVKNYFRVLPLLATLETPLLFGVCRTCKSEMTVSFGKTSITLKMSPVSGIKKKFKGKAAELYRSLDVSRMVYGMRTVTDGVTGLPVRVVIVGE